MGNWSKFILGEKMPDKNDPKYKERYEKDVELGKKFARWSRIDKLAAVLQRFAGAYPKLFLGIVLAIIIFCFSLNIYRVVQVYNKPTTEQHGSAVQRQEKLLQEYKMNKTVKTINTIDNDTN